MTIVKKMLSTGVLAFSLVALPAIPVAAQTSTDAPAVDTTPFQESESDFNNLGWLGALGLLGLLNLFRKPDHNQARPNTSHDTSHVDTAITGRTNISDRTDTIERPEQR